MMNIEAPIPENSESLIDEFNAYYEIVNLLRKHCPWDKEQTNESIAPLILEEAHEMLEAVHKKDYEDFSKELGDLLLHIVMHSVIAEEGGHFDFREVMKKNREKLIRRHPHVFGNISANDTDQVLSNWEKIKMTEGQKSILSGVPLNMPSLLRAERMQHKAARVGFDWDNPQDVWNKVYEELEELKAEIESDNKDKAQKELGDFIFSIVNLARKFELNSEDALIRTNSKFYNRFQYIEKKAKELNKELSDMSLAEMDLLWEEAKKEDIK